MKIKLGELYQSLPVLEKLKDIPAEGISTDVTISLSVLLSSYMPYKKAYEKVTSALNKKYIVKKDNISIVPEDKVDSYLKELYVILNKEIEIPGISPINVSEIKKYLNIDDLSKIIYLTKPAS